MSKSIIAVVGLPGAGKTVAVKRGGEKTGWPKIYFGDLILDEVKKRGLEVNEKNERAVREGLRAEQGMGVCATLSLPKVKELLASNNGVLIESLYSWEEYVIMKNEFGEDFKVLSIYASPATRTARMAIRPERPLTAEEIKSRDYSQIENLHQAGPIARAEYTIVNEGSMDKFLKDLDDFFQIVSAK